MLKKGISIILVMVMIVSIFTIIPFSASAKEDNLGSKVGNDLSEIIGATEFEANVEFVETEGTEIPKAKP